MTGMSGAVSAPCRLWRLPAVSVLYECGYFFTSGFRCCLSIWFFPLPAKKSRVRCGLDTGFAGRTPHSQVLRLDSCRTQAAPARL